VNKISAVASGMLSLVDHEPIDLQEQTVYPVCNPNYELHLTSVDCTLLHAVRASGLPKMNLGFSAYGNWQLPRPAAEYLMRCNGQSSHAEIAESLNLPFRLLADQVADDISTMTGAITFESEPSPKARTIFTTGDFESFAPLHMSIEITDTCNFRCDHCYVSASPEKLGRRDHVALIELFDTMWDNGAKIVELTGGECTTHPHFREILAAAAAKFHLVAVITNGYLLGRRDGLADYVASFDNVSVQISLDGNREFHDRFRKKEGSFDALCAGARKLTEQGVILRIAMSVTSDNVDQVQDVFHIAKAVGARALSVAAITSFGRGANLGMCAETDHALQHEIMRQLAPYAGDPLFDANRNSLELVAQTKQINCGAGWKTFALNGATGEVRSCLFLADSKKFGSVDRDSYRDIFRSEYMTMFRNAPSPSAELDTCRDCSYLPTCRGCFAKAFRISESDYPECPWRHKYFPGMSLKAEPAATVGSGCGCGSETRHGASQLIQVGRLTALGRPGSETRHGASQLIQIGRLTAVDRPPTESV
jgi:radical SAM protein with 4Fe4S-binding SPASM domain